VVNRVPKQPGSTAHGSHGHRRPMARRSERRADPFSNRSTFSAGRPRTARSRRSPPGPRRARRRPPRARRRPRPAAHHPRRRPGGLAHRPPPLRDRRRKLVGQQVMFAHLKGQGAPQRQRRAGKPQRRPVGRLLGQPRPPPRRPAPKRPRHNVVVPSGDTHSSWALDISDDPNDAAAYDPARRPRRPHRRRRARGRGLRGP
jgi:hypothetical protein